MKHLISSALCWALILSVYLPDASAQSLKKGDVILKEAEQWLELIDQGEYFKSWEAASNKLQENTTKRAWHAQLKRLREKLGELKSRTFSSIVYHDAGRPGIPLMCTLYFSSQYDKAPFVNESVLLIIEKKTWKATGYFVN